MIHLQIRYKYAHKSKTKERMDQAALVSKQNVQFASPFCIVICLYSLIYFILRGVTYIFSFVFACWMILGGWTAGIRIPMEKRCFDAIPRRSEKYQKNYGKSYFPRRRRMLEGEAEMGHRGPTPPGVGHP